VKALAPHLQSRLRALGSHPLVGEVRGIGLIGALQLVADKATRRPLPPAEGIGTLIYANEYQQIRPAKKKDIRAIQVLTDKGVQSDELVKRTRAVIEKQLGDYHIFEIDKNTVACVALHVYPEQNKGELACLFVSPSHENQGIGRKLIQFVEAKARELNLSELLTLSTQAFTYFQSKGGFSEGTPDDLPPGRREKYDLSGRNSKVLVKKLK
jgi:amino-acid N-acetyltransferase